MSAEYVIKPSNKTEFRMLLKDLTDDDNMEEVPQSFTVSLF